VLLRDGSGRDRGTLVQDGRVAHEPDEGQYDRQEEVFFFCGAAVLLRTAALEDTGGFDPRYFMYYEDLDLSWRLRLRSWKVVYVPTALVEHDHAASSGEWSPFFRFHVERNRPLLLLKLAPWSLAAREVGRYLAGLGLNAARVLGWAITRRQRGPHAANARVQARVVLSWLPDLPGVLADRRRIRTRRRVPDGQIARWMR
jgi:GT2 family glycosyltransferase